MEADINGVVQINWEDEDGGDAEHENNEESPNILITPTKLLEYIRIGQFGAAAAQVRKRPAEATIREYHSVAHPYGGPLALHRICFALPVPLELMDMLVRAKPETVYWPIFPVVAERVPVDLKCDIIQYFCTRIFLGVEPGLEHLQNQVEAMKIIIRANSRAVRIHDVEHDRLPLHAIVYGMPDRVRGGFPLTLLREVFTLVLEAHPNGPLEPDGNGCLVLHVVCTYACHLGDFGLFMIQSLVTACPDAVSLTSAAGLYPLNVLMESFSPKNVRIATELTGNRLENVTDIAHCLLRVNPSVARLVLPHRAHHGEHSALSLFCNLYSDHEHEPDLSSKYLWHVGELLLRTFLCGTCTVNAKSKWRVVHAIASLPLSFRTFEFLKRAIELYPEQLSERSDSGNTPLMLAVMAPMTNENGDADANFNIMELLLNADPSAVLIPNRKGVLPLSVAIVSKKDWTRCVRLLVHGAPDSLVARERRSRLYPFMIAASVGDVSLSFELLKFYPDLIRSGISVDREIVDVDYMNIASSRRFLVNNGCSLHDTGAEQSKSKEAQLLALKREQILQRLQRKSDVVQFRSQVERDHTVVDGGDVMQRHRTREPRIAEDQQCIFDGGAKNQQIIRKSTYTEGQQCIVS